jgi:hypothetical protein
MFVKGKIDFKHIQIWLGVCLSKERLTSNISKYDFGVCFLKENLTLDISKYNFKYFC